jgi:hypothetical protein
VTPGRPALASAGAQAGSAWARRERAATRRLGALLAVLAFGVWWLALAGCVVSGAQVCAGVTSPGLGRVSPDPAQASASVCVDVVPRGRR